MSSPPTECTLDLPWMTLSGLAWGPEDGAPLLALHGWLDNAASFAVLAPLLSAHRVVAIDLPGHGRSAHRPAAAAYHFVDYVIDVLAAADALGWPAFALLGHSMGAAIAALVAGTVPDRITHLALCEGLGPMSTPASDTPAQLARANAALPKSPARAPRTYAHFDEACARVRETRPGLSQASATLLCARAVDQTAAGWVFRHDRRLHASSRMRLTEEQVLAFLAGVSAPSVLVAATRGWPVDPAMMKRRTDAVRGMRVERLEGHHHLHMDDAEAVAQVIGPFLGATPAPVV